MALVLSLLGIIPYLGVLFRVILFLFNIVYGLFLNLFYGIQHAAFYAELQDAASPAPAAPGCPAGDPRTAGPEGGGTRQGVRSAAGESTRRGSKTGRRSE